jgi:hypothetical protein
MRENNNNNQAFLSQEGLSRLRDETHMRRKRETKAKVKKGRARKEPNKKRGGAIKKTETK